MVQLLLVLNLIGIVLLFLVLVNLYLAVRALKSKYEELEKELIKEETTIAQLKGQIEQIESKLTFLSRELKATAERVGEGRSQ